MRELHSLLKRQLKRYSDELDQPNIEEAGLLHAINEAYWQSDIDREMLEHSMEVTSQELLEMNSALQNANTDLETRVAERTTELYKINEQLQEELVERKRTEEILQSREAIMSAVASSAQQLIRAEDWQEVIPNILAKLGRATEVNRVYVFRNHLSPDSVILTTLQHEWVTLDTEPQIDNPDLQNLPLLGAGFSRWVNILGNDNVVYGNVQDFPQSEQELLSPQGILSLVVVPIFVGEQWWGFIGFDECKSARTWDKAEIHALKTAAGTLGSAILHETMGASLRESEDHYRGLFENSPIAIWEEDFSEVKRHIDILKQQGVTDFRSYFASHPDEMVECKKMVRVVDVNKAALEMYQADSKEELIRIAMTDFSNGELENILEDLIAIAEGKPSHGWEGADETLKGKPIEIALTRSVAPGHEDDYSKVLVTTTDITERRRAEVALHESQLRYQSLFDNSSVLLWEEDYSQVKNYFDQLCNAGVTDFQEYFDNHPEAVKECANLVQVLDVNRASLDFMEVEDKSELLGSLSKSLNEEAHPSFKDQLVSLANGNTSYESDEVNIGKDGNKKYIFFSLSVSPGYAGDLNRVVVSIMDVTARKRIEDALRESEERFVGIVNSASDGIISIDPDQRIILFNPSAERMFGCNAAEAIGQPLERFIPEQFRASYGNRINEFAKSSETNRGMGGLRTISGLHSDGTEFPMEVTMSRTTTENETLYTVILRDITERKQAEDALRTKDVLLQESQRIARLGHYKLDILTGIWKSSEILDDILGIDKNYPRDIAGWGNLVHPAQRDEMINYFTKYVLEEQNTFDREYRIIRTSDQQERWVQGLGRLEHDQDGNPVRMIGTIQDITERKLVEESLQESQKLFSIAFEYAPIGIALVAPDGHWIRANHALLKLIGYTEEELLGKTFQDITHPDDLEKGLNYVNQMLTGKIGSYQMEKRYFHKSGHIVWVLLSVSLVKDNYGHPQYFISQIQDIMEQKRTEAETIHHLTEMEALYKNGLAVGRLLKPGEIGQQIIETFAQHLSWHHVAIRLRNNESDELALIALNQPGQSETEKAELERYFNSMVSKVGEGLS
ncbi:MAG TPA: PAS domain S-box protein, partial [Anaerolineales bacterium]|nr:PAS domain S-box protein [Anaerolineales bacterium]